MAAKRFICSWLTAEVINGVSIDKCVVLLLWKFLGGHISVHTKHDHFTPCCACTRGVIIGLGFNSSVDHLSIQTTVT